MKNIINLGIIGYGYWGINLVRNFTNIAEAKVKMVCDLNPLNLKKFRDRYPQIKDTINYQDILANSEIDAVVIATPTATHFKLVMEALRAGKHVLVEKPITDSVLKTRKIIEEAEQKNLVLMVDHTFIYTAAVQEIKRLISQGTLGDIYYYDAVRANLGKFQPDVNVVWDLAVHDLAIMDYVLPFKPYGVSAIGMSHLARERENIAYVSLFFAKKMIAHLHLNWLSPIKLRRTLISGDRKMLVYDDLEAKAKVKVHNKGITMSNQQNSCPLPISYRNGDISTPQLDSTEALYKMGLHFIQCIKNRKTPLSDGKAGLRVIKILEAASQSIKQQGALITGFE